MRYERPACIVRQQILTLIETCDKCNNKEFYWWPVFEPIENKWQEYTCTRCIDSSNRTEKIKWFVSLYRMRMSPDVFDYFYLQTTCNGSPLTNARGLNGWKTCDICYTVPPTPKTLFTTYTVSSKHKLIADSGGKVRHTELLAGTAVPTSLYF